MAWQWSLFNNLLAFRHAVFLPMQGFIVFIKHSNFLMVPWYLMDGEPQEKI